MFGNLRTFPEMFGNVRLAFGQLLKIRRKSSELGSVWKASQNRQNRRHWYVHIINRILHASLWIQILSRVQLDIELNTRR